MKSIWNFVLLILCFYNQINFNQYSNLYFKIKNWIHTKKTKNSFKDEKKYSKTDSKGKFRLFYKSLQTLEKNEEDH